MKKTKSCNCKKCGGKINTMKCGGKIKTSKKK